MNAEMTCEKKSNGVTKMERVTVVVKLIYRPTKEFDCGHEGGDLGQLLHHSSNLNAFH